MGDPCGVIWMHGLGDTEQGWPAELAAQQAYWFPVIAVVDEWLLTLAGILDFVEMI